MGPEVRLVKPSRWNVAARASVGDSRVTAECLRTTRPWAKSGVIGNGGFGIPEFIWTNNALAVEVASPPKAYSRKFAARAGSQDIDA
jgi:hypothetical protein